MGPCASPQINLAAIGPALGPKSWANSKRWTQSLSAGHGTRAALGIILRAVGQTRSGSERHSRGTLPHPPSPGWDCYDGICRRVAPACRIRPLPYRPSEAGLRQPRDTRGPKIRKGLPGAGHTRGGSSRSRTARSGCLSPPPKRALGPGVPTARSSPTALERGGCLGLPARNALRDVNGSRRACPAAPVPASARR